MKKSLFFILSLSLILIACEKDESIVSSENTRIESDDGYIDFSLVHLESDAQFAEDFRVPREQFRTLSIDHEQRPELFAGVKGEFVTQNRTSVEFWALRSGDRSDGELNSRGSIAISLDVQCVQVNGNESVVGGLITKVYDNGGNQRIQAGLYLYIKLVDDDDERAGTKDKYSSAILIHSKPACEFISTDVMVPERYTNGRGDILWDEAGVGMLEVMEGQIGVFEQPGLNP